MSEIPDPRNEDHLHNNITQKLQIFAKKHFEIEQDDPIAKAVSVPTPTPQDPIS